MENQKRASAKFRSHAKGRKEACCCLSAMLLWVLAAIGVPVSVVMFFLNKHDRRWPLFEAALLIVAIIVNRKATHVPIPRGVSRHEQQK